MSGKLFLQIVVLMILFAVITTGVKYLKMTYCPMGGAKAQASSTYAPKMAK